MKRLLYALRFMTVIPLPYKQDENMTDVARSLSCFPLIGLLIGTVLWLAGRYGLLLLSPLTAGFLIMILSMVITGGLHLDGLSDLADGLGGGRTREKRLEIMKDSRIGAFGALTLIGFLLLKGLFLYEILASLPADRLILLILPPLWARGFAVLIIKTFPTARPGGMGDFFQKNARTADLVTALLLTLLITLGVAWVTNLYRLLPIPLLLSALMLIPAGVIKKMLGGLTGDCYGALIEGAELASLFLLIIFV